MSTIPTNSAWENYEIAPDQTHHIIDQQPAYTPRFLTVLKFHEPGFAAARDASGAFHINTYGKSIYSYRFLKTFGFYNGRASVESLTGWCHILTDGIELYQNRYAWCGNFQQHYCVVKDLDGNFFHINEDGKRAYLASYKYVGDFHDGFAVVQNQQGLHTHIDFKGSLRHSKWFINLDVYHKGFARACDEDGWFHIDIPGNSLYSQRYKNIEPFYNGIARVETNSGALHLINEKGEKIHILREEMKDEFHQVSADLVSYWRLYTLYAANNLQLIEYLPSSVQSLSNSLLIPEETLLKLLGALQEMGYVEKLESGSWQSTTKGSFLHSKHPFSLKSAAMIWQEEHLKSWQYASYSLKTKRSTFQFLYGKGWFEWLKDHPEKNTLYHHALTIYARKDYQKLSSLIDFKKHRSLLDIGGSSGTLLIDILDKNTHLHGMLIDLPNVLDLVRIPMHLNERMQLIPINFFEDWPLIETESAILSRVLHDWPNSEAVKILKKVYSVLTNNPDSRIYIVENILNHNSGRGSLLNLNMLIMTEGVERSLEDFNHLLEQAGFILETTYSLNEASSVLVAKKITNTSSALNHL